MERDAGAIIKNSEGKFLVVRGKDGTWGFPKGHIEKGESEEDACFREVFEEVGLKICLNSSYRCTIKYQLQSGITKKVTFFLAKAMNSTQKNNEEIIDSKWFTMGETERLLTYPETREAFRRLNALVN